MRTKFLRDHPDSVRRLIEGQVQANDLVNGNPAEARRLVNSAITTITGRGVPDPVLEASWKNLEFTNDPIASSLRTSAASAEKVGLLEKVDLDGIYDLKLLNEVLTTAGKPEVKS